MSISIIIVSWNTKALLQQCLESLLQDIGLEYSNLVFVVDNNSSDASAEMVRSKFPTVNLIANKDNLGFGKANNQVLRQLTTQYVFLLNPDTKILPGSIKKLIEFADQHPRAGIVAPQLLNEDLTIQRSCRTFPSLPNMFYELSGLSKLFPKIKTFRNYKMLDFDHQTARQVDQPEGAGLLIRKAVLDEVGVFDEKFFMLFEEVDLCYRIKKAGWDIWFYPESKITHYYGQSIKQVKAKMIISSHKGMYHYWSKHHQRWYQIIFKPFLWLGLWLLAIIRIVIYKLKS